MRCGTGADHRRVGQVPSHTTAADAEVWSDLSVELVTPRSLFHTEPSLFFFFLSICRSVIFLKTFPLAYIKGLKTVDSHNHGWKGKTDQNRSVSTGDCRIQELVWSMGHGPCHQLLSKQAHSISQVTILLLWHVLFLFT